MVLHKETKFGLTFGQVISLLTLVGAILTVWISLNVRMAQAEIRIESLEYNFQQTIKSVEMNRTENREDHRVLMDKLDEIMKIKADK
jgi:hypothetical protein